MPRWMRVLRGMIGTGLTFAAGVGAVASAVAGITWLLEGSEGGREMLVFAVRLAIWAFPIGVAFSGFVALAARGRAFDKLSLPAFAALGAGGGLLLYGLLAANAWQAWSLATAIANGILFVLLGGCSAAASLLLARRAGPVLEAGDEPRTLSEG